MAGHFDHYQKQTACSSQDHLHTMKVYNTQPVSLLLIKFSFFSTTEAFTCSKVINAFKRQNSWTDAFFTKHAWLWSRNDSYSQFPRSPLGTPVGPQRSFCVLNMKKKTRLQIMSLAAQAKTLKCNIYLPFLSEKLQSKVVPQGPSHVPCSNHFVLQKLTDLPSCFPLCLCIQGQNLTDKSMVSLCYYQQSHH